MVPAKNLITLISPVYKKKPFLKKLVNSIKKQPYENWELIFIEDCGNDGSLELLEKYASTDQRVKIIANETNKGVDASRFEGIKNASGEFVMFIDADDWLAYDALSKLLAKAIEENCDIVYGAFSKVIDNFGIIKKKGLNSYSPLNQTEMIRQPVLFDEFYMSYFGVNKLLVSMWGKLYKRSIFADAALKPTGFKMGEDLIFNMVLHPYLNKVAFIPDVVYYYRWGGMTNNFNPTFLLDIKDQYYLKKKNIVKYNYQKALPFIKYELANCFYSHFLNQLLLEDISKKNLQLNIMQELEDKIYGELEHVEYEKAMHLYNREIEAITQEIWRTYKGKKYNYKFKKIINSILR